MWMDSEEMQLSRAGGKTTPTVQPGIIYLPTSNNKATTQDSIAHQERIVLIDSRGYAVTDITTPTSNTVHSSYSISISMTKSLTKTVSLQLETQSVFMCHVTHLYTPTTTAWSLS